MLSYFDLHFLKYSWKIFEFFKFAKIQWQHRMEKQFKKIQDADLSQGSIYR